MLEGLFGSLVWVAANGAYRSYVREGEVGFKRFAAFWLGFPITLVSAFLVRPRKRVGGPRHEDDDERALLLEIRRDHALREASSLPEEGPGSRE